MNIEELRLTAAVEAFAEAMKAKLLTKVREGEAGWADPVNKSEIERRLRAHVERGMTEQAVDIANLAMFLWAFENGPRITNSQ